MPKHRAPKCGVWGLKAVSARDSDFGQGTRAVQQLVALQTAAPWPSWPACDHPAV